MRPGFSRAAGLMSRRRVDLPLIVCDAADFDGTNDYATRGAGLTNAADSKLGTLAFWLKADTLAADDYIFSSSSDRFRIIVNATGKYRVEGRNAAGTVILGLATSTSISTTAWQCLLLSFDMADAGKRHLYLGDTSEINVVTYTDDTVDFTTADWGVGAKPDGTGRMDMGLAELQFWPGVYVDFSAEANRRMFFSATGKPVDPNAASGAIATLGTPRVYFHLDNGETANNFVANDDGGDGGAFTVTGALSTYASSPSD